MLDMLSPSDPLFFVHHANVDRIWSLWQDYYGHDETSISHYETPRHYEGRFLDRPLRFAGNRMFLMDNGNPPTPRDVLSNNGVVNVLYKNDQLARRLRYDPNPDWIESAPAGSARIWCDRDWFRRELKSRGLQMGKHIDGQRPSKAMITTIEASRIKGEVEDNISSSVSMPSLRRGNAGISHFKVLEAKNVERLGLSKYRVFVSVEKCLEFNDFTNQDEQRIWDKHCQEIPLSTTLAERMALLAQEECKERNNPLSASPDFIRATNMTNELAAFECFHLPDQDN